MADGAHQKTTGNGAKWCAAVRCRTTTWNLRAEPQTGGKMQHENRRKGCKRLHDDAAGLPKVVQRPIGGDKRLCGKALQPIAQASARRWSWSGPAHKSWPQRRLCAI